jgi:hypothetical protein
MPHHPEILSAIEAHQLIKLAELLSQPAIYSFDALNENNETYLHIAARKFLNGGAIYGLDIIEHLLKLGTKPGVVNIAGKTAFQCGDVNAVDGQYGCTPLQHTVREYPKLSALFEELVRCGADVNKPGNDGRTPLSDAAYFCKPELMARLVQRGANVYLGYGVNKVLHNPLQDALESKIGSSAERQANIHFFLDRHVGIALRFNENDLNEVDLSGKVLIAADLPENIAKHNPSIEKAIRTFDSLKDHVTRGAISMEKLREIKMACCHIRNDLLATSQNALTLIKLINQMNLTWPELKPIDLELPKDVSSTILAEANPTDEPKNNKGGCVLM